MGLTKGKTSGCMDGEVGFVDGRFVDLNKIPDDGLLDSILKVGRCDGMLKGLRNG